MESWIDNNWSLITDWSLSQALLQLPYLNTLYGYSLKLLRYADTTTLASLVRADWTFYSSHPALFLSTYLAHGLLVDYFEKKRRCGVRSQEDSTTNLEWLASLWDWYTSYLLHPIASLQQVPSDHSDWEDDPNFLFHRLAFPDLWLRPLVNMDYIKALPTWRFRAVGQYRGGGCNAKLEEETDSLHSDTESKEQKDPLPAGPSRPSHSSKRHKRSLCNEDSNTQLSVYKNMHPVAAAQSSFCCRHGNGSSPSADRVLKDCCFTPEGVSNHQHCDWSVWPCHMLQCSECVVCLENFVSDELLMGLPCGHAFHQQCIVVWLAAGRHCCPVCRWPSYKKKQQRAAQSSSTENTLQDW